MSAGLQLAQPIVCKEKLLHGFVATQRSTASLSARCQRGIPPIAAMASYDISGDAPIKIEASPALDCIAQIEKLKAECAALAKANKWDEAMSKYGEVVDACVASMGTVS